MKAHYYLTTALLVFLAALGPGCKEQVKKTLPATRTDSIYFSDSVLAGLSQLNRDSVRSKPTFVDTFRASLLGTWHWRFTDPALEGTPIGPNDCACSKTLVFKNMTTVAYYENGDLFSNSEYSIIRDTIHDRRVLFGKILNLEDTKFHIAADGGEMSLSGYGYDAARYVFMKKN